MRHHRNDYAKLRTSYPHEKRCPVNKNDDENEPLPGYRNVNETV